MQLQETTTGEEELVDGKLLFPSKTEHHQHATYTLSSRSPTGKKEAHLIYFLG